MKMNNRLLSLILVVVMILGMFPLSAIATDENHTHEVTHIEGCSAECAVEGCACTCHVPAHIEGCSAECAVEGCTCTCHQPMIVNDDPTRACDKCDGIYAEDGVTVVHNSTCPTRCSCTPVDGVHVAPCEFAGKEVPPCEKCNAVKNADGTITHETTCEKVQYVPTCNGKLPCSVVGCTNTHCTGDAATCPIAECACKKPLCDKCEATKGENGAIVHKDDCLSKCKCEAVVEGVHSNWECPFYVKPVCTKDPATCMIANCVCRQEKESTAVSSTDDNQCKIFVSDYFKGMNVTTPAPLREPVVGASPMAKFMLKKTTPIAEENEDFVLTKTLTPDNEEANSFKLKLEAYATGDNATIDQIPVASDIVLILDESGSMNDCIECNHEILYEGGTQGEDVTTTGHVLNVSDENNTVLFRGHKVYGSDIFTDKTYRIIYPVDGTTRDVYYCEEHDGWYSTDHDPSNDNKHTGAKWVPFTKNGDKTPTSDKNQTNENTTTQAWISNVQFYCVCDHDTERVDALRGAVNNFMDEVAADSIARNIDNRVAIVGFSSDLDSKANITRNGARYYSSTNLNNLPGSAFLSAKEQVNAIKTVINEKIVTSGATETHNGIQAAKEIFAAYPISDGEKRNRVVILFTDGAPGSGYAFYDGTYSSTHTEDWTNPGIEAAEYIKNNQKATVYTIGLFPGADASSLPDYTPGQAGSGRLNPKFYDNANRLLQLVSSNYLNATSMLETGSKNADLNGNSYYLSTENEEGLYEIFGKLANLVKPGSTTVTLGTSAVTKDIVTKYFKIPNAENVKAWTESFNGGTQWTKDTGTDSTTTTGPLTVQVSDNIVTVTNFNFAENYVATDVDVSGNSIPRGKKLVFEIPIEPVDGFLGGHNILTNEDSSGVYASENDTEAVDTFDVPDADVPVKQIIPQTKDGAIYLSQAAVIPHVANIGNFKIGDEEYTIDGTNNGYVDIKYSIQIEGNRYYYTIPAGTTYAQLNPSLATNWKTESGQPIDDDVLYEQLVQDTNYEITCDVISKNKPTSHKDSTDTKKIYVFKPEITFKDSSMNLGDSADYSENNVASVKWVNTVKTQAEMAENLGEAPTLVYTYDPAEGLFTEETPVTVTSVISPTDTRLKHRVPENTEIIQHVKFIREKCDVSWCNNKAENIVVSKGGVNFVVHLKTFDLTIKKTGADLDLDPNSSFLFRVTGPNDFSMDVVINGNNQVVIKGLPIPAEGTTPYTIKELTDWSWRYEPKENGKTADGRNVKTVEFTNERKNPYWLDGEHYAKNVFNKISNTDAAG